MALPLLLGVFLPAMGTAEEAERNLAQELTNPIASLYTLPIQLNFDQDLGLDGDGSQMQLNFQPLIPFSLNEDWHLISRTIVPFIYQEDVAWKGQDESGLGDILQSFFFEEWAVPLNFIVDQLITIGEQPVSIGATAKYWADSPEGGPEGWGLRLQMTFLWPK